jgi:hypothetical protein
MRLSGVIKPHQLISERFARRSGLVGPGSKARLWAASILWPSAKRALAHAPVHTGAGTAGLTGACTRTRLSVRPLAAPPHTLHRRRRCVIGTAHRSDLCVGAIPKGQSTDHLEVIAPCQAFSSFPCRTSHCTTTQQQRATTHTRRRRQAGRQADRADRPAAERASWQGKPPCSGVLPRLHSRTNAH